MYVICLLMSASMLYYSIYYIRKNPKKLIKKRGYHQLKVQHFIMPVGRLEIPFISGIDRDPDPSTIWTRTRIFQNCTIPKICLQFLWLKLRADFLFLFCVFYIFLRARVWGPHLCLGRLFCIFERCLNSNPESCRSNLPSFIITTVCVHWDVCANVSGFQ